MHLLLLAVAMLQAGAAAPDRAALTEQVLKAEGAFAKSMADRDHAAFSSFLAEDTIFLGRNAMRGKAAVAQAWKGFFEARKAPFSWRPERVEVNDGGTLALSTGPVFDPDGTQTGNFSSIWRREADGKWKIVFDSGCNCVPKDRPPAPSPKPAN
jgi:ketosteroid isomerase-like protein